MASRHIRSFAEPDQVIELEKIRLESVSIGGLTVSHETQQPGWRWSTHVKPVVGTEWCEHRHVGLVLRGTVHAILEDGTELEAGPFTVYDIPARHDAWVVGDEPVEIIAWTGVKGFLEPMGVLADRVVATIVFTDVVDSTTIGQRLGDRVFADLISTLESRSADIVARYRGKLVKTTGDGILATFDGAARAVRCAIELRATAAELGLPIRTAVHSGEIEKDGDDVRGLAVHEASRILGAAGADEILVSATTAGLAGDIGVALVDRGEHALRGLNGVRRFYAVGP